ncbi:hypothetical protein AKJ09_03915 [Labilithrix luteola]|uniref:Uncharacterized protein n=1 Tax=Labilithrix luteola TaxID=1391654 RepID=A0A0K1PV64_9BACT|nr:hypothetical protein AKJ09_03915 [Labilithrix luteola]
MRVKVPPGATVHLRFGSFRTIRRRARLPGTVEKRRLL